MPSNLISKNSFISIQPNICPEEEEDTVEYQNQYRFTLVFGGNLVFGWDIGGIGRCEVVLRKESDSDTIHVLVLEPKNTGSTSVTNRIEHIATQIYWGFLQGVDPGNIQWAIQYDEPRQKRMFRPTPLFWDGAQFWWDRSQAQSGRTLKACRPWKSFWRLEYKDAPDPLAIRPAYLAKPFSDLILSPEKSLSHEAWEESQTVKKEVPDVGNPFKNS